MQPIIEFIILSIILTINIFLLLSFIGILGSSISGAPFVPTSKKIARKMIELAQINPGDTVYDLGCGDGRLVFMASEKGAHATGIEISWPVFLWAKILQKIANKKGSIERGSMWDTDVSDADVIFLYLFPKMVEKFEQDMFPTLKKGCRIVVHGFAMKQRTPQTTWRPKGKKRGKLMVYTK